MMLGRLLSDIFKLYRTRNQQKSIGKIAEHSAALAPDTLQVGWHVYSTDSNLQRPFDIAVVMPTIGRSTLEEAIRSVHSQHQVGRIQLLIGVDAPLGDFRLPADLLRRAPKHITTCLFYPGYSTSVRHGGLHPARDGGVLRTTLTYLANARYVAYLDDDNFWNPNHLHELQHAIQGRMWAYSRRWFIHPNSRRPICVDDWESVGPGKGIFAEKFGGWVDPNCLMLDKLASEAVIRLWSIPLPGDQKAMSADRQVFDFLAKAGTPGVSRIPTVFYSMDPDDPIHTQRLQFMGQAYENAAHRKRHVAKRKSNEVPTFSFLLPTRNRIDDLTALLTSIETTTSHPEALEIVLGIDEDDAATRDLVWESLNIKKVFLKPGQTMGNMNRACHDASTGRYLMLMNDDMLLRTPAWDEILLDVIGRVGDDAFLIHVNDLLFGERLCCFPMVSRTYCEMASGICPSYYERYRIDDHIHQTFSILGQLGHQRIYYLEHVVFEHLNFEGTASGDRMYLINQEVVARDAQRFDTSIQERITVAQMLAKHIQEHQGEDARGSADGSAELQSWT